MGPWLIHRESIVDPTWIRRGLRQRVELFHYINALYDLFNCLQYRNHSTQILVTKYGVDDARNISELQDFVSHVDPSHLLVLVGFYGKQKAKYSSFCSELFLKLCFRHKSMPTAGENWNILMTSPSSGKLISEASA